MCSSFGATQHLMGSDACPPEEVTPGLSVRQLQVLRFRLGTGITARIWCQRSRGWKQLLEKLTRVVIILRSKLTDESSLCYVLLPVPDHSPLYLSFSARFDVLPQYSRRLEVLHDQCIGKPFSAAASEDRMPFCFSPAHAFSACSSWFAAAFPCALPTQLRGWAGGPLSTVVVIPFVHISLPVLPAHFLLPLPVPSHTFTTLEAWLALLVCVTSNTHAILCDWNGSNGL